MSSCFLFSPWRQGLEKAVANSFKSSVLLTVLFFICMLLLKLVHACVEQKSFISAEDGVCLSRCPENRFFCNNILLIS